MKIITISIINKCIGSIKQIRLKMIQINVLKITIGQDRLRKFQNSCARLIYGKRKRDHVTAILQELHWLPTEARVYFKLLCQVFKCLHDIAPAYLSELISIRRDDDLTLNIPRTRSKYGDRAFSCAGPRLWNALPSEIRLLSKFDTFKSKLKHLLFSSFTQFKQKVHMYRS